MSEAQQTFTFSVPLDYKSDDREIIGKLVVRRIQERTREGIDKEGSSFEPYSDSYKKSLDFKIAGKSNTVDLQLTGDMLGTLDVLEHGAGFITVGYRRGSDENDRAAWQQENTQPGFPKRLFLGLPKNEINEILKEVPPRAEISPEEREDRVTEDDSDKAVDSIANKIFDLWGV